MFSNGFPQDSLPTYGLSLACTPEQKSGRYGTVSGNIPIRIHSTSRYLKDINVILCMLDQYQDIIDVYYYHDM